MYLLLLQLSTKAKRKMRRAAPERPSITKAVIYDQKLKNKKKLMIDHSKQAKSKKPRVEES